MDILRDNKFHAVAGFKIHGLVKGIEPRATISDLIDSDLHSWKQYHIKACFDPFVSSHIISIPLSWSQLDDILVWNFKKDSLYFLNSTYHILGGKREVDIPGPSSQS